MLTLNQQQPNPTPIQRRVLTAFAHGATREEAAQNAGLTVKAVSAMLERMRNQYAPTMAALIALAVKLEWVTLQRWVPKYEHPQTLPPPTPRQTRSEFAQQRDKARDRSSAVRFP